MSKRTLLIANGGPHDGLEITNDSVVVISPGGKNSLRIAGGNVSLYGEAPLLERVKGTLITGIGGSAQRLVLVDGSVALVPDVPLPELLAVGGDLLLQGAMIAPRVQFVGGRLLTDSGEIHDKSECKIRCPALVDSRVTADVAIAAGLMVIMQRAKTDEIGESITDHDDPPSEGPGMFL